MSNLCLTNKDDHPEAAAKHLEDARILQGHMRSDGSAYLSGYVVECCLKTLIQVETGTPPRGHDLRDLSNTASKANAVAGAGTAMYISSRALQNLSSSSIFAWRPELRYRAVGSISAQDAGDWLAEAQAIYVSTVASMKLDGVIT